MPSTRNDPDQDLGYIPRQADDSYANDVAAAKGSDRTAGVPGVDPDAPVLGTPGEINAPADVLTGNLDAIKEIRRKQLGKEAAKVALGPNDQMLLPFDK